MALSVHRPVGVTDAVIASGFPSSMNASHLAVAAIQTRGNDLITEGEDGTPVYQVRLLGVFMISGAAAADGTQPTLADHPVFSTKFILDSGATMHVTGNKALFPWLFRVQQGSKLSVANGHQLPIRGLGTVIMENFRVSNVHYVPDIACNAISVSELSKLEYSVVFTRGGCQIKDLRTGEQVGSARLVRGLYILDRLEIPLGRAPAVVLYRRASGGQP